MTRDDLSTYWESLREARQKEIQILKARLSKLEREQPIIEGAWVILSEELEQKPHVDGRYASIDIGRLENTSRLTKTAQMINAVKVAGPMTAMQVVEYLHGRGIDTTEGSVSSILSSKLREGTGIVRVGAGMFGYQEPNNA